MNDNSVNQTIINLKTELKSVEKQINAQKIVMSESPRNTEKQYIELTKLEAIRDQLLVKISEIEKNNFVSNNMATMDEKMNKINANINKAQSKMGKSRFKFINNRTKKRLEKLKKKRSKIQKKQRKIVNTYINNAYKEFYKYANIEGKFTGKNRYYDSNISEAKENINKFNNKIVDDNKLIHKVTNKYFKLRTLPSELKKQKFEKLKTKNIIKYGAKHSNKVDLAIIREKIKKMNKELKAQEAEFNAKQDNTVNFGDYVDGMSRDNIISFQDYVDSMQQEEKSRTM